MTMELKEGDDIKLSKILEYLIKHPILRDTSYPTCLDIEVYDYPRLKLILLKNNSVNRTDGGNIKNNLNTNDHLKSEFYTCLYKKQLEEKQRQKHIDRDRKISIRNKKWALPISIISGAISLVTVVLSICKII